MAKTKIFLIYSGLFILGLTTGMVFEDSFHKIVRQLYCTLTYNKLSFGAPKFDILFFTFPFVFLTGLYFSLLFYLLHKQTKMQRLINAVLTLIFLPGSIILFCYFDGNIKLIECTACDDGTRVLLYKDIGYTKIFFVGLLTSLIPALWTEIKARRKINKQTIFKASL